MSKGNTFENDLVKLIFQATAIANIADNAASSPLTNLYVSLHTADPGETGDQTTNETAYTGYARVAVARSGSGFTVTNNSVSPAANIDSPNAPPARVPPSPTSASAPAQAAPASCSTKAPSRRTSRWLLA